MKILITGFEAFDQSAINPSEKIVKTLSRDEQLKQFISPLILPVDQNQAPDKITQVMDSLRPDIILCLGEAASRPVISIERVAVNLMDFRIPDNSGNKAEDQAINPNGPAAYFATIPVRKIYQNIRSAGIPAELSLSAGAYLCNQIFYTVSDKINQEQTSQKTGFIHVPSLPEQVVEKDKIQPSMALLTSVQAIKTAIHTILDQS